MGNSILKKFFKYTAVGSSLAAASTVTMPAITTGMDTVGNTVLPSQAKNAPAPSTPNVIFIVLDDMGFSDLGCYGSEIKTHSIDRLAANGLRYNNFCTTPVSSPTRASLLTGRQNNSVGMGNVADVSLGPDRPNMQGRISPSAGTIAEILSGEGFGTFGVGKWHAVPGYQMTPGGPFENWPLGKGFDRYYGFLCGETDQYHPQLIYDNHEVTPPDDPDYHLSEDLLRQATQFITDQVSIYPEKPFFMYFALGAPHSPFQVPRKYIDMYEGVYEKGWDALRQERFDRQLKMGIIPEDTVLAPSDPTVPAWETLTDAQKKLYVRFMETYAGYITHADEQIGKLVDFLESIGVLNNTMIFLISDNGASSSGGENGLDEFMRSMGGPPISFDDLFNQIDNIGGPDFQALYPKGWAQVSNTPFQGYKGTTYAGGIREPLIVHWPDGIRSGGNILAQHVNVMDITPTVLDVLDIPVPEEIKGVRQMPMQGISFSYSFKDSAAASQRTMGFYFMHNSRAVYRDGWKAVAVHTIGQSFDEDVWQLYNTEEDYSESKDLAAMYPERMDSLAKFWWAEAERFGALPLIETSVKDVAYLQPDSPANRRVFRYIRGVDTIGWLSDPPIQSGSYTIEVPVERESSRDEGVLVCTGGNMGGYTLYILNNRLVYEYNRLGTVYKIVSDIEVPTGKSVLKFSFISTGALKGSGSLYIDNEAVGQADIQTVPVGLAFEGFDVGRDTLAPVSESYAGKGDFEFSGKFKWLTFEME